MQVGFCRQLFFPRRLIHESHETTRISHTPLLSLISSPGERRGVSPTCGSSKPDVWMPKTPPASYKPTLDIGLTRRAYASTLANREAVVVDRHWLLSNTCYGNWLPGAAPGFVGRVWEHRPFDPEEAPRVAHDLPGT